MIESSDGHPSSGIHLRQCSSEDIVGLFEQFALPRERSEVECVACLLPDSVDLVQQRTDRVADRDLRLGHRILGGRSRSRHEVWSGNRGVLVVVVHDTTTLAQGTDTELVDLRLHVRIVAGDRHVGRVDGFRVDVVPVEQGPHRVGERR